MAPNELAITIQFTTVPKLFEEINAATGDALIVTDVSQQDYTDIVHERDRRRRKFRIKRYYPDLQILIVTIPTEAHEVLHTTLFGRITAAVWNMGLGLEWVPMGATTCRALGHPNGDVGEGDSTAAPRSRRPVGSHWPTLVIEAGCSQSLQALRTDMRWWFSASDHQVKIVLLVKYEPNSEHVIIEKWLELQQPPSATTTRAVASIAPARSQVITIDRGPNPTSHTVLGGPLQLEFELLFLRAPRRGETDIAVSAAELQGLIGMIWG